MELRDYQEAILNELRKGWKQYNTHLIKAPTGAGKTVIAGTVIKGMYDRGMRVIFTVPKKALIDQTVRAFYKLGIDNIGVMQADHPMTDPSMPIQVATVQTLARRKIPDVDCITIDEAHTRSVQLLKHIEDTGVKVIGLSATPYAKWLGNVYEHFINVVGMADLQRMGYLSQYEFYAPTKPDVSKARTKDYGVYGPDYVESDIAEIMGDAKIAGNIITTWLEKGEDRPTIAFCCNVAHANHLTIQFRKAGVNAEVMVGSTPDDERARIIRDFEDGIVKIILSVDVLTEGFDSDVRCVIYAKPTKSEMRWTQSIGRAVRLAHGKDNAIILDHSGTVLRLGMPHEIEYDELFSDADQYKIAQQVRKEKSKEKTAKECPKCNYMKKPGEHACPKCGFAPIAGEDVETAEHIELSSINKVKAPTKEEKQRFYSELLGWKQERGRNGKPVSDGYVANLYKAKFKVWPRNLNDSIMQPTPSTRGFIKSRQIAYAKSMERKK